LSSIHGIHYALSVPTVNSTAHVAFPTSTATGSLIARLIVGVPVTNYAAGRTWYEQFFGPIKVCAAPGA
jgi:hypothetical protein